MSFRRDCFLLYLCQEVTFISHAFWVGKSCWVVEMDLTSRKHGKNDYGHGDEGRSGEDINMGCRAHR